MESTYPSLTTPKGLDSPTLFIENSGLEEKVLDSFFLSRKPSILENIEEVTSFKGSKKKSCSANKRRTCNQNDISKVIKNKQQTKILINEYDKDKNWSKEKVLYLAKILNLKSS